MCPWAGIGGHTPKNNCLDANISFETLDFVAMDYDEARNDYTNNSETKILRNRCACN